MKLLDAIFLVGQMPEGSCICSRRPFHQSAEAVITGLTSEHRVPASTLADGYEYFLEQNGVLELLEFASTKRASRETKAELVVHYAQNDAYPAWFYDLPDEIH
jgi:hypothetical protein